MKRILCAVDLSEQSVALVKRSAAIDPGVGSLTVLHVVPTFDATEMHAGGWFDPVAVVYAPPREEILARIRQLVAAAGVPADHVHYRVEAGEPAQTILDQARALRVDLIVVGTREAHERHRQGVGPVAEAVLRHAECDVLTVPTGTSPSPADGSDATIVCGVDFSPQPPWPLRAALELAERAHARALLVHVIDVPSRMELSDEVLDAPDLRSGLVHNAQDRLDALVAGEAAVACAIRTRVAVGRPSRELLRVAAEDHATLIVLGSQPEAGVRLPGLGSTVEQIVGEAPCPVLAIRRIVRLRAKSR